MTAHRTAATSAPGRADIEQVFAAEGLAPQEWGNAAGATYGWHAHRYHKVLYCIEGSITFHTHGGDLELRRGDRLDIEPGTKHAATVGDEGVRCLEAQR